MGQLRHSRYQQREIAKILKELYRPRVTRGSTRLGFRRGELHADGGVVRAVQTRELLEGVGDILGRGGVCDSSRRKAAKRQSEGAPGRGTGELLLFVVLLTVGVLRESKSELLLWWGEACVLLIVSCRCDTMANFLLKSKPLQTGQGDCIGVLSRK